MSERCSGGTHSFNFCGEVISCKMWVPSTLHLELCRLKMLPGLTTFLEEPDRRSIVGKAALEILLGVVGGSFEAFVALPLL